MGQSIQVKRYLSAIRRVLLCCGTALGALLVLCGMMSRADGPDDLPLAGQGGEKAPFTAPCLTAGDDGPFFSLQDLAAYRLRPRRYTIRPPIWQSYPSGLETIPIAARSYTTETIEYLTQHEVHYGDRQRPAMALTFDCEAGSYTTRKILDTLREQQVRATFFILGRYAYLMPDLVAQMVADGHEIGNHSFFHPLFTDLPPLSITLEITYTEAIVDWAAEQHVPMRYLRFPYGGRNETTRRLAAQWGYQSAFWDIDPRGWEPGKTPPDVIEHIRDKAHPGGIVIMHCNSVNDAEALATVIQTLRELGLTPGTLSDVLTAADRQVPGYPE